MAISRTGYSSSAINTGTNSNGSFDITVPANTDCLIVYATGYYNAAHALDSTGPGTGVTCESAAADAEITSADLYTTSYMGAGWVFLDPPTGSGVTIAYDFSNTMAEETLWCWVAYSGVGSIRGVDGTQRSSGPQFSTNSLTSSSGDLISVCVFGYILPSKEGSVDSWNNATEISEFTGVEDGGDLTLAEHSSTGNVTISTASCTDYGDGGIMAVVMVPAGGTTYTKTSSLDGLLNKANITKTSSLDGLLNKANITKTSGLDAILTGIFGTTCFGHVTGVEEENTKTFTGNGSGTATISGSGDSEVLIIAPGEYWNFNTIDTNGPQSNVTITLGKYVAGNTVTRKYRTGTTQAECEAASFSTYSEPVSSDGFFQARLEG